MNIRVDFLPPKADALNAPSSSHGGARWLNERRFVSIAVLPRELMRLQRTTRGPQGRTRAISPIGKTWMNGSTLRVRFIGGTAAEQNTAREQAGWWSQVANLKFDFNNAPNAEIRIKFDPNDGAWSYVGTDSRSIPVNEPTMNLGFLDGGTAAHEFGHAIGLAHEHQNPAGGIQWNEEVVIREMAEVTQLLGRGDDASQHPAQVPGGSDQRNGVRSRFDHAVLLSCLVDLERHRHQGERSVVASGQGVHCRREDVSENGRRGVERGRAEGQRGAPDGGGHRQSGRGGFVHVHCRDRRNATWSTPAARPM